MKIGIIGGGFIGLTVAFYLTKNGHQVTIFEKESTTGGLAASFNFKNLYFEKFVHHFFNKDKELINLIYKFGLKDKLVWYNPQNAIFYKNKIYPFTTALNLLNFSPLKFSGRVRCGLITLYLKIQKNYHKFENISAQEWIKKFMGEKTWDIVWRPLFKKKFNQDFKKISMTWFWARIFYRSWKLGYLKGSLKKLTERLESSIKKREGKIF